MITFDLFEALLEMNALMLDDGFKLTISNSISEEHDGLWISLILIVVGYNKYKLR